MMGQLAHCQVGQRKIVPVYCGHKRQNNHGNEYIERVCFHVHYSLWQIRGRVRTPFKNAEGEDSVLRNDSHFVAQNNKQTVRRPRPETDSDEF